MRVAAVDPAKITGAKLELFLPWQSGPDKTVWPVFEPLVSRDHHRFTTLPELPLKNVCFPPVNPAYELDNLTSDHLIGRRLLLDELLPYVNLDTIQEHLANGLIHIEAGLTDEGACRRCGNHDSAQMSTFPCFRCKKTCAYCRACLMMGRVSGCSILVSGKWNQSGFNGTQHPLVWSGTLSNGQTQASRFLSEKIGMLQHQTSCECLLWAVCGAGKTEMLFNGIEKALNTGLRVLVATPRTDVVKELEPRFREAFPKTEISACYGGAERKRGDSPLVISTTHQQLRYYRAFDVVIVDEVDAFPYSHDPKLTYAVNQAARQQHLLVYLTATPDRKMQERASFGKLPAIIVPRRYHRFPLPVPSFCWTFRWKKKSIDGKVPRRIIVWLERMHETKKQVFLFVPTVRLLKSILPEIQKQFPQTEGVYSEDPDRMDKVARFRSGNVRFLLTTTILERGVTVKGVQVAVFGADDSRFTESALVQIAGRAGRSPDEPDGEVCFFHDGITRAMARAKKQIETMNMREESGE
ncbi:DEAD/DEAH box helicase [Alteribacter lacisalsi]|nr:DEAD/DEAH box helicase family protein [Alteribacter lacisalsi]